MPESFIPFPIMGLYIYPSCPYVQKYGEPYSDPQVEQFIKDKLYPDSSNVMTDGDGTIVDFGERC